MRTPSHTTAFTLLASLCLVPPAAAYHFEDTLRGTTQGNQLGGSLGSDGWTVTAVNDRIWYSMPTLVQGSIEFTLAGVSNDKFQAADHEMFTLYEGGYGISEPIDYGHLKPLFYRVMWRLRGEVAGVDGETVTHQGEQKFIWIMCPDGAPGYAVNYGTQFCSCSQWLDQGPSGGDMTWTGVPERIRFEWDGNSARYLRNGVVVDTIDWTGTGLAFTPSEPHFCLGSPRSGAVSYAVTVVGAVYSDLVVDGVEGPQQLCPGTVVPDAGTPPDAGSSGGTRFDVLQDVTGASWESGVYSVVSDLNAESPSGGGQGSVVYLRFPPVGGTATNAILRLHTLTIAGAGGGSGVVCRVDDDTWNENTLTWANRPAISSTCAGTSTTVAADTEVIFNVTTLMPASGDVNLAITTTDADAVHYYSKESGGTSLGPRLDVEVVATTADSGVPVVDSGVPVPDSGVPVTDSGVPLEDGGAGVPDAGDPVGSADAGAGSPKVVLAGSCGCSLGSTGEWTAAALVVLATRSRRRRADANRSDRQGVSTSSFRGR